MNNLIVTAATHEVQELLDISTTRNRALGHKVIVYGLDDEVKGADIRFEVAPEFKKQLHPPHVFEEYQVGKSPWKPQVIADAMVLFNRPFVWMDADAFAVKRFDEVWENEFDIAVTLKRQCERTATAHPNIYGYLNAGVIFVCPTPEAFHLCSMWHAYTCAKRVTESQSDQEALNRLLIEGSSMESDSYNTTVQLPACKIRILRTDDYNWSYFNEPLPETTKILHFKTDVRERMKEYL